MFFRRHCWILQRFCSWLRATKTHHTAKGMPACRDCTGCFGLRCHCQRRVCPERQIRRQHHRICQSVSWLTSVLARHAAGQCVSRSVRCSTCSHSSMYFTLRPGWVQCRSLLALFSCRDNLHFQDAAIRSMSVVHISIHIVSLTLCIYKFLFILTRATSLIRSFNPKLSNCTISRP